MTAMQLFLALEGAEDRFVLEAEQPPKPALWKPIAVAAAALLVVLGAVWAARTVLAPPQPPALAQETTAPAQTPPTQTAPSGTTAPPAADETVDVSMMIMSLFDDPSHQIEALTKIMGVVQDQGLVARLAGSSSVQEIAQAFIQREEQ